MEKIKDFNPRSHERSDFDVDNKAEYTKISIHAPTRGATATSREDFIDQIFQSTLPREERRAVYYIIYLSRNFNPRSHERSDQGILA